jgi:hypothetical protein
VRSRLSNDAAAAGRPPAHRLENPDSAPLDDAAFAGSGADRSFDRQGVVQRVVDRFTSGLLHRREIPQVGEPLAAVEALAAG